MILSLFFKHLSRKLISAFVPKERFCSKTRGINKLFLFKTKRLLGVYIYMHCSIGGRSRRFRPATVELGGRKTKQFHPTFSLIFDCFLTLYWPWLHFVNLFTLLCLTPDDFTRQGESSQKPGIGCTKANIYIYIYIYIYLLIEFTGLAQGYLG